jgi:hypothetical protein
LEIRKVGDESYITEKRAEISEKNGEERQIEQVKAICTFSGLWNIYFCYSIACFRAN